MIRATARLVGSVIVGVVGLLTAALVQRPEPAVVAAPFLAMALVAMTSMRTPRLSVEARLEPSRVLEGEELVLTVTVVSHNGGGRVQAVVQPPAGVRVLDESSGVEAVVSTRSTELSRRLEATEWGALGPVTVTVTASDRLGMFDQELEVRTDPLRVLPRESTIQRIVSPRALRSIAGVHLSRQRGDGIEFVDTRLFVPGDRARSVNWRVSARRDELWVDERRPERSSEVVLFLDSFVSVGDRHDNTLRRSVEVAGALAMRHIAVNDRIGLVELGGVLRWVRPGGGTVQLYRIIETLIETETWASSADKTVDVLPVRALPRRSLVVALTPLMDPRGIGAIQTLRARGFDVAVIEVSPSAFVVPRPDRRGALAHRLWRAERDQVRAELRAQGITVAEWTDGEPLDPVIDSLRVFRDAVLRSAR